MIKLEHNEGKIIVLQQNIVFIVEYMYKMRERVLVTKHIRNVKSDAEEMWATGDRNFEVVCFASTNANT